MTSHGQPDADDSTPMDLRALDPDTDSLASARFERAVMSRIGATGKILSMPTDPLYGLWSLPRSPLLAASIITLAVLGLSVSLKPRPHAAPATIAESMGVPPQLLAPDSHK